MCHGSWAVRPSDSLSAEQQTPAADEEAAGGGTWPAEGLASYPPTAPAPRPAHEPSPRAHLSGVAGEGSEREWLLRAPGPPGQRRQRPHDRWARRGAVAQAARRLGRRRGGPGGAHGGCSGHAVGARCLWSEKERRTRVMKMLYRAPQPSRRVKRERCAGLGAEAARAPVLRASSPHLACSPLSLAHLARYKRVQVLAVV